MKLLFITNFYPPVSRGGYEQWCQEVALGLRDKSHDVRILTSRYQVDNIPLSDPDWVMRSLYLEMEFASLQNALHFFMSRRKHQQENLDRLQNLVESFSPDAILVWGMWNLHRSLPALAEKLMPGSVVYYMGDYWPTLPDQFENYWQAPPRNFLTGIPKLVLKPLAQLMLVFEKKPELHFEHIIFPTEFMQNELRRMGISPKSSRIVHGAIDTSLYAVPDEIRHKEKNVNGSVSLLYVGRLTHEKGVHTAIQALGYLKRHQPDSQVNLTVVGTGEPDYEGHLRQIVRREDVDEQVTFMGAQPKETLPALYRDADIFLFTSIWPEPFGRVVVEAMVSGVVVLGTMVGGAAEILKDGLNALTFTPDDPVSLAQQLIRLIQSNELRAQLIKNGRETALDQFDIVFMTNGIEAYLQSMV